MSSDDEDQIYEWDVHSFYDSSCDDWTGSEWGGNEGSVDENVNWDERFTEDDWYAWTSLVNR